MEERMVLSENSLSWVKITAAQTIVGIFDTYEEGGHEALLNDEIMYTDFIYANYVLDEIEEEECCVLYPGWDAYVEAREWYKENNNGKMVGEQ